MEPSSRIRAGKLRDLRIIEVCTSDFGGGAERVCLELAKGFRKRGHNSWLVAGKKYLGDGWIIEATSIGSNGAWRKIGKLFGNVVDSFPKPVRDMLIRSSRPRSFLDILRGREDFNFPWTKYLYKVTPYPPDVIHLHNLHGNYFDLRVLPQITQQGPTTLTLHDAWLLSGHCAHSFECERWKTGCGECPDLTIYPAIRRDGTAYNWQRKRDIYAKSRLYVAAPSLWLMRKVEQSILSPAIVEARVIPNGVDLKTFSPADKAKEKLRLGWTSTDLVVLLCGNRIRRNPWRDYDTLEKALRHLAKSWGKGVVKVVALGEGGPAASWESVEVVFEDYKYDPSYVASFFRAADVFVHVSKADTFPNVVLESLACGTPVVASAVGGIPEQIKGLQWEGHPREFPFYSPQQATGILVPPKDPESLAKALRMLLNDGDLRELLGKNAAVEARVRFDLEKQVDTYLDWFEGILSRGAAAAR